MSRPMRLNASGDMTRNIPKSSHSSEALPLAEREKGKGPIDEHVSGTQSSICSGCRWLHQQVPAQMPPAPRDESSAFCLRARCVYGAVMFAQALVQWVAGGKSRTAVEQCRWGGCCAVRPNVWKLVDSWSEADIFPYGFGHWKEALASA